MRSAYGTDTNIGTFALRFKMFGQIGGALSQTDWSEPFVKRLMKRTRGE